MSKIMIIIDGMQDVAYDELGGLTPYDSGKGESMRKLEAESATAFFKTTPDGFEADTKDCTLTMLGVKADEIPRGRSYLESLAEGVEVGDDDMIMRSNFVQISPDGKLEIPCFNAPPEVAEPLLRELRAQEGHFAKPVGPYKSLERVSGARKWFEGMQTNPPHNHTGGDFEKLLPSGNEFADSLADFSRRMLEKYRPHTLFNWGQAVKESVPRFSDLHDGISGGIVTKTLALSGIAKAMGMECPDLPTCTGDTDTDLAAKVDATLALAKTCDFVLLHVGGTDEATHRQDVKEKAAFISKIDEEMLKPILAAVPDGTQILLTCDHEAYCTTAGHTEQPVKAWLWEKGTTHSGELGLFDGIEMTKMLVTGSWRA